ncbi:MAG: hypothetical protein GEU96_15375 [Propionibacteriales bacterium]|nr:hypothetical protein [Propionibacteriales bacterium]
MPADDELRRKAIRAVLIVAGIAVVLGLVVALTATAALRMAGLSGGDKTAPTFATPRPNEPEPVAPSPSAQGSESPDPPASTRPAKKAKPRIVLEASSAAAATMERITLSGTYRGGDGVSLQVQRREDGSWVDFPTTARVESEAFSTYVELGQPGENQLRVVDPESGKASNQVVITVS